jgi:hypothetical protein
MTDPRDYKLDLSTAAAQSNEAPSTPVARPFLGVRFACCGVYQRVYRSADGSSYQGRCPRCGKQVKFTVGPGGTDVRQFIVSDN